MEVRNLSTRRPISVAAASLLVVVPRKPSPTMRSLRESRLPSPHRGPPSGWLRSNSGPFTYASSVGSGRAPSASSSPMVVSTPARSRTATGPGSSFSILAALRSNEARVTSGSVPESTR